MTIPLLSEKQKAYLISGGVVVLCLTAFSAVTSFFLVEIEAASRNLFEKKAEIAGLQNREQNFSDLEKKYKEIQPGLTDIDQSFLKRGDFLPFILALEKIAQKSGNRYENKLVNEFSKSKEGSGWATADFQITLEGDFFNLLKFLTYLENMPYAIKMTNLRIQEGGRAMVGVGQPEITTIIDLGVFVVEKQ